MTTTTTTTTTTTGAHPMKKIKIITIAALALMSTACQLEVGSPAAVAATKTKTTAAAAAPTCDYTLSKTNRYGTWSDTGSRCEPDYATSDLRWLDDADDHVISWHEEDFLLGRGFTTAEILFAEERIDSYCDGPRSVDVITAALLTDLGSPQNNTVVIHGVVACSTYIGAVLDVLAGS